MLSFRQECFLYIILYKPACRTAWLYRDLIASEAVLEIYKYNGDNHVCWVLLEIHDCVSLNVYSSYLTSSRAVCVLIFIFGIVGTFLNTMVLFVFLKSKNNHPRRTQQKWYWLFIIFILFSLVPSFYSSEQCSLLSSHERESESCYWLINLVWNNLEQKLSLSECVSNE